MGTVGLGSFTGPQRASLAFLTMVDGKVAFIPQLGFVSPPLAQRIELRDHQAFHGAQAWCRTEPEFRLARPHPCRFAALVPEWDNGQRYFSEIFRGGSVPHDGVTEASITIHYVQLIIPKSPRQ